MHLPYTYPFPPDDNWVKHRREVKRCRGACCYGALVIHFGTESPKDLELRVDGRSPYCTDSGDPSISNKYRRWRQGKSLPNGGSVRHVFERSGGSVRLDMWRDLVLWELLDPENPSIQRIHQLLEGSSAWVRKTLFFGTNSDRLGRNIPLFPDRTRMLGIRNQYSLEAFLVLLCLARKAELLEQESENYLSAACAFDIFPRVLYTHPQLLYRWEGLYKCLASIYWRPEMRIETIRASLEVLKAKPAAKLPMLSGERADKSIDPLTEWEQYRSASAK